MGFCENTSITAMAKGPGVDATGDVPRCSAGPIRLRDQGRIPESYHRSCGLALQEA